MAEPLKKFFDQAIVRSIAKDLKAVFPSFNAKAFERQCLSGLDRLELIARGWHIADALHRHLPASYEQAVSILVRSLPNTEKPSGMKSFKYLPYVFYVARYGIDHLDLSMHAQYELTKRFTAEFSVRPFLERYPAAYSYFESWVRDPDEHVRRLVSEGSRPRLPWAPRLRNYQRDPRPVLKLLEQLKDDPALYVRRSVANNLSDIGKDHPDVLIAVVRRWWKNATEERKWIIRHALRSLIKTGDPDALALLGFGGKPRIRLRNAMLPVTLRRGTVLNIVVELESVSKSSQNLMVDCAVHFIKARGGTSRKVFKLRRMSLTGLERVTVRGRVSFAELTTRKSYPGAHRIDLLVNGHTMQLGSVLIT